MDRQTADSVWSLCQMSKAEILRGFVTETLAATAREILAAVDRTVAGYEEEAAGFRLELERQRRQLEVLQPHVTLSAFGVTCRRSLCHVEEEEEEEGEDEEEQSADCPENLEDWDNQTPSRSFPSRVQFEQKKTSRPQISKIQNHIDLRICILEDSQTEILSKNVLKNCPVLKLQCPRGLQEAEFLDLLRATFPQLAGVDKPFDILTSNKRSRLQHLRLKTVTAEEIETNITCTGSGKSPLYIRLKAKKEPQARKKEFHLPHTDLSPEDSLSTSVMLTCDETGQQTSSLKGARVSVVSSSSTQQQDMEPEEAADADHIISGAAEDVLACSTAEYKGHISDDDEEEEEGDVVNDDDHWKPDKSSKEMSESYSESQSMNAQKQKARRSRVKATEAKTEAADAALSCKVCGALHRLEVTFIKHAWSHVDDLGSPCGVCGELLESSEALKDHLQNLHETADCHICGEPFLSILSLNEHVAAHSGETPYECDVCHDMFALKVSLENHQKVHEAGKPHRCYTCHEVFELKEELKAHHKTHTNKKTHLCGVCGKSLSDYRSLSRHRFTHTGERPHSCQICGRHFKLVGTLRQHEKTHMNRERSYLCDVCCKMFLTSKQLQIHMRTHTNEKPYRCRECGKGFTTKGPLTIHMRVHTGETPYRCPDCGWSFKRKSNLDDHLTVHSGVKAFVCGICGKACSRKTHLTVHMRTHNGERPYKCTLCDKAFTQSHCLKTHMKSHLVGEASV